VSGRVPRLCLIADATGAAGVAPALEALPPGAALVQLRDKALGGGALLRLARALLSVCREHQAPLLVNDRADVALAAFADGIHLPANGLLPADARALLGPRSLVGMSCHEPAEVVRASRAGADFCIFGPVWETPGKGPSRGVEALATAVRAATIPVLAVGGIDARTAALALAAGASGVACIRAILRANDPARAAADLWRSLGP
jgi:thiamine-phosphate pyrophosphorylase